MLENTINTTPRCSDTTSKRLMSIFNEVTRWFNYYCANCKELRSARDREEVASKFRNLEEIFAEYAGLKGKTEGFNA